MHHTYYEDLLLIVTISTVLLQCFVIYMVQTKTPQNMRPYRFYLNNFTAWDMIFTIILGILLQPFPVTPLFASSVRGLAFYGGNEVARVVAAGSLYSGSCVICAQDLALIWAIIYPDRRVHNFFVSNYFKIPWAIFVQLVSVGLAAAIYLCFVSEADLPAYLATERPITIRLIPGEVILYCDVYSTRFRAFAFTLFGLFALSESVCFTFILLISSILRKNSKNYSAASRRLHYQFLKVLAAQIATPVVLILGPVFADVALALSGTNPATIAVQTGFLAITFYGFTNAAVCIWFVGPYRKFANETLVQSWLIPLCQLLRIKYRAASGNITMLTSETNTARLDLSTAIY